MSDETGTQLTDAQDAPTETGKAAESTGKDPVVSGLSKRLNAEKARADAAEARLAELAPKAERTDTLEREVVILRKKSQYSDVAPALEKIFEKGLDPNAVDDDFVAAIRLAATGAAPKDDLETPTLNAVRTEQKETPADFLKKLPSFWEE